jgi:maltoporin
MKTTHKLSLLAVAAALCAGSSFAADVGGIEFHGYSRGGPVLNFDTVKGGLTLGGDLQKYRLGNEGDNGIEIDLIKNFEAGGMKWKVHYMPSKWGSGTVGTEQAFVEMSGLSFAPEAKIWAGQRRLRIQDVHVVDTFLMNYGDSQGAGVTDIGLGGAKLGVGVFTGDKFDLAMNAGVKANRVNADISEIKTNPGGTVRVLLTAVNGTGLAGTNGGTGFTVSHNQENFLVKGLTNSVFLQTSNGHARIDGEFINIDGLATSPLAGGVTVNRFAHSLNWQNGAFGGQTNLSYATKTDEIGANAGVTVKETSIGGRVSYAFNTNFKLLAEAGSTSTQGLATGEQTLNKVTIAPTISVGPDFWSRPEVRFYVTQANWNAAAAAANATTFGAGGKTSTTVVGVQYEIWW